MALEPMAVAAAVCHPTQRDALALPLHPLQKGVLPEDLLAALHRTLVTLVNQVGAPSLLGGGGGGESSTARQGGPDAR